MFLHSATALTRGMTAVIKKKKEEKKEENEFAALYKSYAKKGAAKKENQIARFIEDWVVFKNSRDLYFDEQSKYKFVNKERRGVLWNL